MATATPPKAEPAADVRDPGWVRVGQAIKDDRQRRGMTRGHLVARAATTGAHLTERSLALVEQGRIECKGGASIQVARRAWTALGWSENLRARIQVDGHSLPPLPDRDTPRPVTYPAASLTGRLQAARADQLARLHAKLTDTTEQVRTELIRLGHGLTALDGDPVRHHAAAARTARQLINRWSDELLADLEDNDYTAPAQEE